MINHACIYYLSPNIHYIQVCTVVTIRKAVCHTETSRTMFSVFSKLCISVNLISKRNKVDVNI